MKFVLLVPRSATSVREAAMGRHQTLIKQAIRDIANDPERPGSKHRPEIIIKGARTYRRINPRVRRTR